VRKEGCFFPAGASADLHDDVARIPRVPREEPPANALFEGSQLLLGCGELVFGQFPHLGITLGEERAGFVGRLLGSFELLEHLDDVLDLGAFAGQLV
jgi:hypothetical protein